MNLFPYETVREHQDSMLQAVRKTVQAGTNLVVHAPTGLGKTAAALAPALEHAIEEDRTVLFLTSRLTQHKLALETVQEMRERHGLGIRVVDLVGKKHMCLQPAVQRLSGKEFSEYCKNIREDGLCEYYERLRKDDMPSQETRTALIQLGKHAVTPENTKRFCAEEQYKLCPYEISMMLARRAKAIIADYSYIFNPSIREGFFSRISEELDNCILIIDEGHNLPDRVKDLATERMTTNTLKRAMREAEEHAPHLVQPVKELKERLDRLSRDVDDERYLSRDGFLEMLEGITPAAPFTVQLQKAAVHVREERKSSSLGALGEFLEAWAGQDEGYTRILSTEQDYWRLDYRCLDPSVVTRPIFQKASSTIVMSGTLTPVEMYAELLGLEAETMTLESPFPDRNRLNLIIPRTTTKYTSRSPEMYAEIAGTCGKILGTVSGNTAIFFPSYAILEEIKHRLDTSTGKTVLAEHQQLSKEDREILLNKFRSYSSSGAVLLGVMGGSFSEGIDLPGDELRAVIIVGLPLGRPDLETKALIKHYDGKFGKGWDYGYVFPAFNRTLQSAGRCIRSETDRGAIILLDERYAWRNYYRCFPEEWDIRVSLLYEKMLRSFFDGHA